MNFKVGDKVVVIAGKDKGKEGKIIKTLKNDNKVLVEGISKNDDNMFNGRTDTGKTVIFPGESSLVGKYVNVQITTTQTWILKGQLEE